MTTKTETVSETVSVSVSDVKAIAGRDARLVYLVSAGLTIPEARAFLKKNKDELKTVAAPRATIASEFYALLESGPMSDDSFNAWIAKTSEATRKEGSEGPTNTERAKSHYNAIRVLANAIHAQSKK